MTSFSTAKSRTQKCRKPLKSSGLRHDAQIGHCIKDGLNIDPFHGSGTLGVCCEKLNREGHNIKWIGIELEQKWCDIAKKRINKIK